MVMEDVIHWAAWTALGTALAAGCAEWLHARRTARVVRLAFGPSATPRRWVAAAPFLRVAGHAPAVWALVILLGFDGTVAEHAMNTAPRHHLLVLLDVSPSMEVADAGGDGTLARRDRSTGILKSIFARTAAGGARVSMACMYRDARMLVKDCEDREVILHFADRLPLHLAFPAGDTSLMTSLNTAGVFVRDHPPDSVTMLVITDGDTVPESGLRELPRSVSQFIIAGVGNPRCGTLIDGHESRQNAVELARVARRLNGVYHDANEKEVPSTLLAGLDGGGGGGGRIARDLRGIALLVLAVSSLALCLLPMVLDRFGSGWTRAPVAGTRGVLS